MSHEPPSTQRLKSANPFPHIRKAKAKAKEGARRGSETPKVPAPVGMHGPRGSRYCIIKELGLKDHDDYGFRGLSP